MGRPVRFVVPFAVMVFGGIVLVRLAAQQQGASPAPGAPADTYLLQTRGAVTPKAVDTDFGLGDSHVSKLRPYPAARKGDRTPFDLWRYAGRGSSSFGVPTLPMSWDAWVAYHRDQKPRLMADVRSYMRSRYDFSGDPSWPRTRGPTRRGCAWIRRRCAGTTT